MLQWPREIPINRKPGDVHQAVNQYREFLQNSEIPKLLLYAEPGAVIDKKTRVWCEQKFKNLHSVLLGKGFHFLQEDYPLEIGNEIVKFMKNNTSHDHY
jgi:haloalkane dehalogenase